MEPVSPQQHIQEDNIMDDDEASKLYLMRLRSNVRVSNWRESTASTAAAAAAVPRRTRTRRRRKECVFILISIVALCLLSFVGNKKSQHNLRRNADFDLEKLEKCDLSTYPLWKVSELKELDLSGCGGEKLNLPDNPNLWSSFSSLKKLDLNNNHLNRLPQSIENLTSLEILFLSENEFEAIPEVVGKLKKLRVISLRGNLITNLSTLNLPTATLEWLILTNNRIQTIDADIKDLKLLKKLMLSHNNISEIPAELGDCQDLELVRLADNNIRSVPASVLTLSKLAWVSLSGNPFSSVRSTSAQEAKVITESELEINETDVLGSGASGTVFKGSYRGEDVAVKMFKAMSKGSDGNSEDEAHINSLIDTPYAISALGVIPAPEGEGKYKGMVMKLLDGTYPMGKVPSFRSVTRDEGAAPHATNLSTQQVMSAIWNIASALEYIHTSVGICHGDVYLHNILRDGKGVARLSDWGASFVYDRTNVEVASKVEKIEVLAFGRLVQDLFNWNLNVAVPDSTELGSYLNTKSGSKTMTLIASILQTDQSKRPTFREIKETLATIPEFEPFSAAAGSLVT
jgi:hypothetical protein